MSMKLIGSVTSPYVRKVRVVMAEKKLDYQFITEDVWSAQTQIHVSNPLGKVPCLVMEGGEAVFDSRVIVEYLDTLSPVGKLIPTAGRERAEVKTWEALADGLLDAAIAARLEATWTGRTEAQRCEPVKRCRAATTQQMPQNHHAGLLARALAQSLGNALANAAQTLGVAHLGDLDAMADYVEAHHIDQVWVALPMSAQAEIQAILARLDHATADIKFVPDLFGQWVLLREWGEREHRVTVTAEGLFDYEEFDRALVWVRENLKEGQDRNKPEKKRDRLRLDLAAETATLEWALAACPACIAAPSAERIAGLAEARDARLMLSLPTAHCAACISTVEQAVQAVPGVDSALLDPREAWADKAAYDRTAQTLVQQFIDNFAQFADQVDEGVRHTSVLDSPLMHRRQPQAASAWSISPMRPLPFGLPTWQPSTLT